MMSTATTTTTNSNIIVPYNTSLILVSLVAFLSPITTLLVHQFLYNDHHHHDDDVINDQYQFRYLQIQCGINSTTTESTELLPTWQAIKTTTYIAAAVAFLCLLGYELFRRDPIVGKYVYDRKRLTQPGRSPPPLMLSRSLWRGYDDDGEDEDSRGKKHQPPCCKKVRPAILELLFLNLDKNYIRYSRAADEARKERERRGYYECCRTGCFHNNCCSNHGKGLMKKCPDIDFAVDEDGYAFYPGFSQEYSHIYQVESEYPITQCSPQKKLKQSVSFISSGEASLEDRGGSIVPKKWTQNIGDLFPEDDRRHYFASHEPNGTHNLLVGNSISNESSAWDIEKNGILEAQSKSELSYEVTSGSVGSAKSVENGMTKDEANEELNALLEETGNSKYDNAVSGEDDRQISQNAGLADSTKTIEDEKTREAIYTEPSSKKSSSINGNACTTVENSEQTERSTKDTLNSDANKMNSPLSIESTLRINNVKDDIMEESIRDNEAGTENLKYPSRLKYIFMPPGFHTWGNAFHFIGYFFLLPYFFQWCRRMTSKIPTSPQNNADNNQGNRRASIPITNPGKDLTEGEKELLRCAGLDTYLLVRLARFGFDVTFYPFLTACITVLPIYQVSNDSNPSALDEGYLSLTINSIPNQSRLMIWIVVFTIVLYMYVLRRLWLEWELFIKMRHAYLAAGDTSFHKHPSYLKKYRNTCMVECVPQSHRSDVNLYDVFESLFPGQIEHAEMLIDTAHLEKTLGKRRALIEKYDDVEARYRYECWRYKTWEQTGKSVGCCRTSISDPVKPKVKIGGLFSENKKEEDAFEYYTNKIKEADDLADKEYINIVDTRSKSRQESLVTAQSQRRDSESHSPGQFGAHNLYTLLVPSNVRKRFFGEETDFFCSTGMVTFKSIASKQNAVQCNLSGQPYWMLTHDAPDPRDVFWSNIGVERQTLEHRKVLVESLLFIGILAWGTIVTLIQKFTYQAVESWELSALVLGYLPALVVSLILLWIPNLFFLLAMRVIRFKSHTRCDEFVMLWNTAYRLANIFFTFFSISLFQALQCLRDNPDEFIQTLADGIIRQSSFLMQMIILATGQETMLQLLQWRSLIKQSLFRPLINLNSKSRRYIDWLNTAPPFEKSFIFGFFAPVLSYGLMIAICYAFMAPIMLGVTALFFWVATKVHTHNALFIYCQNCEGGGKIFYYWNRIVFITLYSSIVIFSGILALKQFAELAVAFLFIMVIIVYCVDKSIENTFVVHSLHLPINIARIHDEEEKKALLEESNKTSDGRENFMYRHPLLNQQNWNKKPYWNFR